MHEVKISVIIPCYNCEKWIVRCLDALEEQNYEAFEVICVDDCSTDRTRETIQNYINNSAMRIILLENKANLGPAESRNNAVEIAKGEWLSFCDSDDWYESNFLKVMLDKAVSDESDLVICEYRKVFESGRPSVDVHYLDGLPEQPTKDDYLVYSKASFWLMLVKKSVFVRKKIPNLRNGEDIAYVPCVESAADKISIVKKVLYNYAIHESSLSSRINKFIYKSLLKAHLFLENNILSESHDVLEYLGIRNVLYGSTINAFKAGIPSREIRKIVDNFEIRYPSWKNNKYIKIFPLTKKCYLLFIRKRFMVFCRIMAKIHSSMAVSI